MPSTDIICLAEFAWRKGAFSSSLSNNGTKKRIQMNCLAFFFLVRKDREDLIQGGLGLPLFREKGALQICLAIMMAISNLRGKKLDKKRRNKFIPRGIFVRL